MPYAHIIGWGKYLPGKPITNSELATRNGLDLDDDWIRARTGIHTRHFAGERESSSTMAFQAAQAALEVADVDPNDLDLIIVGTNTPDHLFPSTACLVQNALGASHAGAFDLVAGCPAFLYALITADRFIRSGTYKYILVIGVECVSRIMDPTDKSTAPFFGDGAGAVVLAARDEPGGILGFTLGADGSGGDLLILPAGGSRLPLSQEVLDKKLHYGRMDGGAVYRFGLKVMYQAALEATRQAGLRLQDIDLFIPHQSNARLIQQTSQSLHLPAEKVFINVDKYANTSSAALPIALCDAMAEGRLQPGNRVLLVTFGAGLTWAGAVLQWMAPKPVKPLPAWRRLLRGLRRVILAVRSAWLRLIHLYDRLRGQGQG